MMHSAGAEAGNGSRVHVSASQTLIQLLWGWLHLAVLWTLAMAQPLLAILADEPAFFVARDNTNGDIVALRSSSPLDPRR